MSQRGLGVSSAQLIALPAFLASAVGAVKHWNITLQSSLKTNGSIVVWKTGMQ